MVQTFATKREINKNVYTWRNRKKKFLKKITVKQKFNQFPASKILLFLFFFCFSTSFLSKWYHKEKKKKKLFLSFSLDAIKQKKKTKLYELICCVTSMATLAAFSSINSEIIFSFSIHFYKIFEFSSKFSQYNLVLKIQVR
jgi:hypothetical protein